MCMVRLLSTEILRRVGQISFAEYPSKRNFVVRVHAEENRVLSSHGPFSNHEIHDNPVTEHRENTEYMAAC